MQGVQGRQRRMYVSVLALIGALVLASSLVYEQRATASSTRGATVALIAPAHARAGTLISVDLVAHNVRNLAGYQATVEFNRDQVRLVGASIADDLRGSGRDFLPLGPLQREGAVVLGAASCPAQVCSDPRPTHARRVERGIDGRVKLGTVRLYVGTPGAYPLTLADVRLVDPQGQALPVTASAIVLNVSDT
ncbi:MAG TPA: hypothetical protein VFZ66_30220 [Herpetosiphonaceae bacterium]